jgi:PRC-barrel domain protein
MKRFLATTAAALVLSSAAFADGHTAAFENQTFDEANEIYASNLIGMRVYVTEQEMDADARVAADGEREWDDIGEIDDIVLTRAGEVKSVIVGVGGFLGIAEKDVAIDMSQLKFVTEEDGDDFFLVVNASAAGVKDAPAYERSIDGAHDMAAADVKEVEEVEEEKMASDTMDHDKMLTAPDVRREGYSIAKAEDLTTEDLTGTYVYGPDDENVGEISLLLLTDEGKLDRAVIDVGGFLGLGEHSVAVSMDSLRIVRADDGSDLRVYIDSTQEKLEAQPEYEG